MELNEIFVCSRGFNRLFKSDEGWSAMPHRDYEARSPQFLPFAFTRPWRRIGCECEGTGCNGCTQCADKVVSSDASFHRVSSSRFFPGRSARDRSCNCKTLVYHSAGVPDAFHSSARGAQLKRCNNRCDYNNMLATNYPPIKSETRNARTALCCLECVSLLRRAELKRESTRVHVFMSRPLFLL